MRINLSLVFLLTTLIVSSQLHAAAPVGTLPKAPPSAPAVKVDWEKFLSIHDPIWTAVPPNWDDSIFLGNGLIGALIYSNNANELGWDIGRTDVTDHRDDPNPMFRAPRMPIGRMALLPVGKISGGSARLDLWNAEARGIITTDRGEIRWRSFVHAQDLALIVTFETTAGEDGCRWEWRPAKAVNPRKVFRKLPMTEADENPAAVVEAAGDAHVSVQRLRAGGEYSTAWLEQKADSGQRVLYLSVGNSGAKPGAREEALHSVQSAQSSGVDTLVASHRAWWHDYYPQSFLTVPDTRMESFYWIQMYKLASATRADRPAMDALGPWWGPTPWPGIWWDLNIQVTYTPVYTANRLAIGESFIHLMDRDSNNFILNAPKAFQSDSSAVGLATSQDGRDDVDADPHSTISWANPGYETLGNLVWACQIYWLHYRYTMDDVMLREHLYPLLTRSVNFYLHLLSRGEDGKLHLPEAWSPEYPTRATDLNYDLALLRWGCQTLLASADRLKMDDPLIPRWKEVLADLTPFPTNADGLMIGRDVPLARSHRHYSHLLAIYPLHLITGDTRANLDLINRSVQHWTSMPGGLEGWSLAAASSMASSIGKGDDAMHDLTTFLKFYIEPNTFYRETGPVIETPLMGANSLQEMLLQSWGGVIRVFPALPRDWQDAAFHQMRAEGGFVVSAVRRTTTTMWVQITSLAGEPCRLKTDLKPPFKMLAARDISVKPVGDGSFELDLHKGETITLYTEDIGLTFPVAPDTPEPWRTNYYGSHAAADRALSTLKRRSHPQNMNDLSAGDFPRTLAEEAKAADAKPQATTEAAPLNIVLVGDSTVTDGAGWGKAFADQLLPMIHCTNTSRGGASTKSFLNSGYYTAALALKPTHVLIQFGHNDMSGKGPLRETDPATTYRTNLIRYIDEARAVGAQPILVTSVTRRSFNKDGKVIDGLAPYAEAMKAVASEKHVPLLDLHARSIEAVERLGPERAAELGPIIRTGNRDGTHLAPAGKLLTANLVIDELRRVMPDLAGQILPPDTH